MRVLIVIASYGAKNDPFLRQLVDEYRSMRYSVEIVVLSNAVKAEERGFKTVVGLPTKDPWSLPFGHKKIFADRLDGFDLFVYSEDDTLVTERNIEAFLNVTGALDDDEVAGFLRSETGPNGGRYFCDVHGPYHWDPATVRRRGTYTLASFTNEHSACYILTQSQLRMAIGSGGFLVEPHCGKYDLLCSAATDPYTQCNLKKFIPISHINDFVVPHLPNKYIGKLGLDEGRLLEQIEALLAIADNRLAPYSLFNTETRLAGLAWSKDYYEVPNPEVVSAIPRSARTVLSIGCGWGALEAHLAHKGFEVIAAPLDPVIGSGMEKLGIKVLHGGLDTVGQRLNGAEGIDCVLMSNVLQFVKKPSGILVSFANLLRRGGAVIAVVANVKRASSVQKMLARASSSNAAEAFETTAVHPASEGTLRTWFKDADLRLDRVTSVVSGRAVRVNRMTLGLANPLLASEFIAVAYKD